MKLTTRHAAARLGSRCITSLSIATFRPGLTGHVQGYACAYDPTGHNLTAAVKLFTELNLGGACTSKSLDFKP